MKILNFCFFVALCLLSQSPQAMDEKEIEQLRDKLTNDAIIKKEYISVDDYNKTNGDFEKVIEYFSLDPDLRYYHGKFILTYGVDKGAALQEYSQFVLLANTMEGSQLNDFMNLLYMHNQQAKTHIIAIFNLEKGNFRKPPSIELTTLLLKELTELRPLLDALYYDAVFKALRTTLTTEEYWKPIFGNVVRRLFLEGCHTPYVMILYANLKAQNKRYEEAITQYTSILENQLTPEIYKTSTNYGNLYVLYGLQIQATLGNRWFSLGDDGVSQEKRSQLQNTVSLVEDAMRSERNPNPNLLKFLCEHYVQMEKYDQAFKSIEKLRQYPSAECKEWGVTQGNIQRSYELILSLTNRQEELAEELMKRQQSQLEANAKIVRLIKWAQEEHQKEVDLAQSRQQQIEIASQKKEKPEASQNPVEDDRVWEMLALKQQQEERQRKEEQQQRAKEERRQEQKKERRRQQKKESTQGVSNLPVGLPQVAAQPQPSSFIRIAQLTSNKHAWETFNALFAQYYPPGILPGKISLHEIDCLLTALDQDFNASKGKGSHKKVTLNFHDFGIEAEEQMITLTNKTYLKPEQIKALRDGFISARIVPDDARVIKRLREEKRL